MARGPAIALVAGLTAAAVSLASEPARKTPARARPGPAAPRVATAKAARGERPRSAPASTASSGAAVPVTALPWGEALAAYLRVLDEPSASAETIEKARLSFEASLEATASGRSPGR